jgi:PTH1 family peptidyl-tRNA hydrolase
MSIKIIVGLRNPGAAYAKTRHNAGSWFVEALATSQQLSFKTDKKLRGEWVMMDEAVAHSILFMPLSFMNVNGEAVRAICQFYSILPHELLIAHDELDLPAGCVRLKTGGGHGGHNGLRDVISHLNSSDFHRLRIGIGHPGHKDLVSDYVLAKPNVEDKEKISGAIERAIAVVSTITSGHIAVAMNQLNTTGA